MSITVGDVVLGTVGSATRRGLALVGPSVNIGARLLKHAPVGTIIASGEVLVELRQRDAVELVAEFQPLDTAYVVPGADGTCVVTYVVPPARAEAATAERCKASAGVL